MTMMQRVVTGITCATQMMLLLAMLPLVVQSLDAQMFLINDDITLSTFPNREDCEMDLEEGSRSHLFFSKEHLPELRARAEQQSHMLEPIEVFIEDKLLQQHGGGDQDDGEEQEQPWVRCNSQNLSAVALFITLNPDHESNDVIYTWVKSSMDCLTKPTQDSPPSSSAKDTIITAHSVSSLAIAFDFIYDTLNENDIERYRGAIERQTKKLLALSNKRGMPWVKEVTHPSRAPVVAAMMIGGIVSRMTACSFRAYHLFEEMMTIYNIIPDGTVDSVAFGSVITHFVTTMTFLCARHFGTYEALSSPFLQRQYTQILYTSINDFRKTINYGDTSGGWIYGPEAQLEFMDTYMFRTGHAKWLANRIAENRDTAYLSDVNHELGHHNHFLRFLWSDPTIELKRPSIEPLVTFNDWGVSIYGGGQSNDESTILALKAAPSHGHRIHDLCSNQMPTATQGDLSWYHVNAGHEHPDAGSIYFAPKGHSVFTGVQFSPKWTWLENTLTFVTEDGVEVGQTGEGAEWLNYRLHPNEMKPYLEYATEYFEHGADASQPIKVAMRAQIANAYPNSLMLDRVTRTVLLLDDDSLIVIDAVLVSPNSTVRQVNTYFHNIDNDFTLVDGTHAGVGDYRLSWRHGTGQAGTTDLPKEESSFLNVTRDLNDNQPRTNVFIARDRHDSPLSCRLVSSKEVVITYHDDEYALDLDSLVITETANERKLQFPLGLSGAPVHHITLKPKAECHFEEQLPAFQQHNKIVLVCRARTGSSLLGRMFKLHSNVHYWFEPLKEISTRYLQYSHFNSYHSQPYLADVVNRVMDCNFLNTIEMQDFFNMRYRINWKKSSSENAFSFPTCVQKTHHVVKSIRIANISALMDEIDNAKILFLVRDPRPSALSQVKMQRMEQTVENIGHSGATYCQFLVDNYHYALNNTRVHVVRYESMSIHPKETVDDLLRFSGLEMTTSVEHFINENMLGIEKSEKKSRVTNEHAKLFTLKRNSTAHVTAWQKTMPPEFIRAVEKTDDCRLAMQLWGYPQFLPD